MSVLLDSHAFLLFSAADPQLSPAALAIIMDPAETKYLSIASVWEMAVKCSIGKLPLAIPFSEMIASGLSNAQCQILPIELSHVEHVASLPFHHRDPFDRLLVAQSMVEGLAIVSRDAMLDAYGVARCW